MANPTGFIVNNANYTNKDLNTIFSPYVSGTQATATGYIVNNANYTNKDLNTIFAPYVSGTQATATGYICSTTLSVTVTGGSYYYISTTPSNGYNYLLIYLPGTGTTTYTVTFSGLNTFKVGLLVIGGGGGGGASGSYYNGYGGAGGGVYYTPQQNNGFTFTNSTYTVVIGGGGRRNSSSAENTGSSTTVTGNMNGTVGTITATGGVGGSYYEFEHELVPLGGTSSFSGTIGSTVAVSASGGAGTKTGNTTFNAGPTITLETGSITTTGSGPPIPWPTIVSGGTFADGANSSPVLGGGNPGTYYGCGGNGANNGNVTSGGGAYPGQIGYGGIVFMYWNNTINADFNNIFKPLPVLTLLNSYSMTFTLSNVSNSPPGQYIATNSTGQYVTIGCDLNFFVSNDYGLSFTVVSVANNIFCVTMSSSGQYQYACSTGVPACYLYVSSNYGVSWLAAQAVTGDNFGRWTQAVACDATGQYIITADGGQFGNNSQYYSKNFGVNWTNVSNADVYTRGSCTINNTTFMSYALTGPNPYYQPILFSYDLAAATVSEVIAVTNMPYMGKWITSSGNGSKLFYTNVNNQGFYSSTGLPSGFGSALTLPDTFVSVWYNSAGTYLWGASSTTIYYSKDNGSSWTSISTSLTNIYGVNISSNNNYLYLVTQTGSVYKLDISS